MNKINLTNIVTIGISKSKESWPPIKNPQWSIRNRLTISNREMEEIFILPKKITVLKHLRPTWNSSIENDWSNLKWKRTFHSPQWLALKPGRWLWTEDSNKSSTREIESNRKKRSTSSNWSKRSQLKLSQLIRPLTRLCTIALIKILTLFATRWTWSVKKMPNKNGSLNQSSTIKWLLLCLVLDSLGQTIVTTRITYHFWSSGKRLVVMSTQIRLSLLVLSRISPGVFKTSTIRRSSTQRLAKITCLLLSAEQLNTVIYILHVKSNTLAKSTEISSQTDATKLLMTRKEWETWNRFRRKCLAIPTTTHHLSQIEQEP